MFNMVLHGPQHLTHKPYQQRKSANKISTTHQTVIMKSSVKYNNHIMLQCILGCHNPLTKMFSLFLECATKMSRMLHKICQSF